MPTQKKKVRMIVPALAIVDDDFGEGKPISTALSIDVMIVSNHSSDEDAAESAAAVIACAIESFIEDGRR